MSEGASGDWTRNGARFVCAVALLVAGVVGLVGSRAHVAHRSGHTIGVLTGVDVNRAGALELALLPGIGAVLSERIVRERELNGPFISVEGLDRVKGIGPRTVMRVRPHAVAGGG